MACFERELWHRLASKYGAAPAPAPVSTRRQRPAALDQTARSEAETQSELSDLQLAWEELVPLLDAHREQLALYVRAGEHAAAEEAPIELDWSTVLQLVDENRDEVWRHLQEGRLVRHRDVQVELLLDWALVQQVRHHPCPDLRIQMSSTGTYWYCAIVFQYVATHEWQVREFLHAYELPPVPVAPLRAPSLSQATQTLAELNTAVESTLLQKPVVDWALVSRYVQVRTLSARVVRLLGRGI